jgi:hypothetical protein
MVENYVFTWFFKISSWKYSIGDSKKFEKSNKNVLFNQLFIDFF